MATSTIYQQRARVSALSRHRPADDPELIEATLNLREAKLEEHIRRVVEAAPPLTAAQRDRLALLLRPSSAPDRVLRRRADVTDQLSDLEG
ncbi:hypothetical protein [Microbacterium sp. CPCC 204701]|uniref:hypothetical protein n=1 Tax=Microbacterium sp. CPCC 204701 TaxID=2493084 RepID=UPI000FDBACA4|nr:hypothetical protein [Microbacterium sp. CPCC 204701]